MKKAYLLSQPSPFAIILQPSTKTQPQVNLGNKRTRQDRVLFNIIKLLTKNKKQNKENKKNNQHFIIYYIVQESYVFESAGKFSEYKRLHSLFIHFYTR